MKTLPLLFLLAYVLASCSEQKTAAADKIFPLYTAKKKVEPGDWLAEHKETYQDLDNYISSHPVQPDSTRKIIYIYKIGESTKAEDSLLLITCRYLEKVFHLPAKIAQTFPLSCVPDSMQRITGEGDNDLQLRTHFILDTLVKIRPKDAAVSICFSKFDLYPGPGWNFVFGQAYLRQGAGVWSFSRYGDVNDPGQFQLALMRTLTLCKV